MIETNISDGAVCPVCQNLRPKPGVLAQNVQFDELAESVRLEQCWACKLIYTALVQYGCVEPKRNVIHVVSKPGSPFFLKWSEEAGTFPNIELFRQPESPDSSVGQAEEKAWIPTAWNQPNDVSELGLANNISPAPDTPLLRELILKWLKVCDETHPDCFTGSHEYPTRLLDVGVSEGEPIRLVENEKPERYVALSHCWGNAKWSVTTTGNILRHLNGISWDELARTFQDAVTVTRRIGIRYLWIDSLCIIQDDLPDWRRESAKMAAIYRGAYLTIAASLTASTDDGFLRPSRERRVYSGRPMSFTFRGQTFKDMCIREVHDLRQHSFHNIQEPLSTRCWTMQERVLSPRLLSFTSAVTFECPLLDACECGHGLHPDLMYPPLSMLSGVDNKRAFRSLLTDEFEDNERMYSLWFDIVTVYSGRRLTYESDRQVAISAIVSTLAQKFGDTYIAGLWKGNFVPGLAWYNADRSPRIKLADDPGHFVDHPFPTWSWLSAERRVFMHKIIPVPSCSVKAINVQCGGATDAGPAQGYITLRARTGIMILHMHEHCQYVSEQSQTPNLELRDPQGAAINDELQVHSILLDTWIEPCELVDAEGKRIVSAKRATTVTEVPRAEFSPTILCLHLGWIHENNESRREVFVLVARIETRTEGGSEAYSRIGLVQAGVSEGFLQTWMGDGPSKDITIF